MMLAVCVIFGLVINLVFIQACDPGEFGFVDVLIILFQCRGKLTEGHGGTHGSFPSSSCETVFVTVIIISLCEFL